MQIKRFEARDMAEALKMVKREFGPQAVILSARDVAKGKGMLGLLRRPGVEVTAATDTHNGNGKPKMEGSSARKWTLLKDRSVGSGPTIQSGPGPYRPVNSGQRGRVKRTTCPDREGLPLRRNDTILRFLNFYEELLNQGVAEAVASDVIERLRQGIASDEMVEDTEIKARLRDIFKELGVSEKADTGDPGHHRVVVLVGPTGVGKTTTMAKIAVAETFQKGKEIALITLNDHRIGAAAQMEAYANILGVPAAAVSSQNELKGCLKRFRDKDLILIDTPGISHNDIYGITALKGLLEGVKPLEIHLLAAAGTREKDFEGIFKKFGVLPIDCLLFTKIDETAEYGPMLNAVVRTKLPVSYLTNGQDVPENIEEGSVERLIHLLFREQKRRTHGPRALAAEDLRDADRDRKGGSETQAYVANKSSELFHHPSCKWVERIDKKNMVVFKTRAEALASNFRPCRACQPAAAEEYDAPSLTGAANGGMREIVAY